MFTSFNAASPFLGFSPTQPEGPDRFRQDLEFVQVIYHYQLQGRNQVPQPLLLSSVSFAKI
jgi:acetoacetate decarboxylase